MAVQRLVCYITAMFLLNMECQGQQCTMGFLSAVSQCTTSGCGTRETGSTAITRIIPDMNFTCNGTVTYWRAAGEFRNGGSENTVLSIWRERSSGPGTYDRVGGTELGICGNGIQAPLVMGMSDVYECSLPQSERVSVQPGDIVGIELSGQTNARFRLHFDDTNGGPTNYVLDGQVSTATLSQLQAASSTVDQPQISLTVKPIIITTIAQVPPTTQPPITTEATSTDIPTTQSPITTEATSIDPLTIQPPTTGEISPLSTTQPSITTRATTSNEAVTIIEIPDGQSNSAETGNSNADIGLIVGSAVGGVVGIFLLSAVAILILVVVFQSRKYKRYLRDREVVTRIAAPQNISALDIEMKANDSYVPVFHQISTENNVAYGEMVCMNQESNDLYETIDPPIEDSTTQLTRNDLSEEDNTEFDYVN